MAVVNRSILLAAIALMATSVVADTLSDLRGTLQRLGGKQPLHATFDVTRSRHAEGRFLTEDFSGTASFDCDTDGATMRLAFGRSTLDRAAEERRLKTMDPKRSAGTDSVLQEVVPQSVDRAMNFAPSLSRLIERGSLVAQRNEPYQGKPARALVLNLPPQKGGAGSEAGAVSFSADRLTVWIAADGVPLGAYRERTGKIGIFLLHADTVRKETWNFAVRGDHLCISQLDDRSVVDGIGEDGDALTTWKLRP